MGELTKIQWAHHTFNPWWGCRKVPGDPACHHCLDPNTPVLLTDMSWAPIGSLKPGVEVAAFTEHPPRLPNGKRANRVYERSVVQKVWRTNEPAFRVSFDDGTSIVASADHIFLRRGSKWTTTSRLRIGTKLVSIGAPKEIPDVEARDFLLGYLGGVTMGDGTFRIDGSGKNGTKQSYWRVAMDAIDKPVLLRCIQALKLLGVHGIEVKSFDPGESPLSAVGGQRPMIKIETRKMANLRAIERVASELPSTGTLKSIGWLTGLLDTDGSNSRGIIRISQRPGRGILERASEIVTHMGFEATLENYEVIPTLRVGGRAHDRIAFVSRTLPVLPRRQGFPEGIRFPTQRAVGVTGIEPLGDMELVDIQTSSGTFIANGIATHNCYAEATEKRWGLDIWGQNKPRKFMSEANWKKPLRWDRLAAKAGERHRVFCASMADVFEDRDDLRPVRERLWRLIEKTPNLDWLLLTKRPENLDWLDVSSRSNVWLGITAATQQHYDERWPLLARHPAAVHFISCEPMMESIDFMLDLKTMDGPRPEWIIMGGESGPKARPCAQEWLEHAVKWCRKGKVPVFVKQLGAHSTRGGERRRFSDSHAGDPSEWPSKLRVRQLPKGVRA